MAAGRSWWAGRCPWCTSQLGVLDVPLTLRNRFRCPHCRNKLRLHLLPPLLISVLIWTPVGIPALLIAWRDASESMWFLVLSTVGDAVLFLALLVPLFVRLARVQIYNRAVPPYTEAQLSQLRDAYRVLQVGFEASALAIKHAYRRKAQRWHPDKWPAESAEQRDAAEQMSQINRAYRLIRHAPLRYQLRAEPKIEAATHRRAETSAPVPRHAPLNDRDENAIRFVVGAAFGLFVAFILSWHGLPGPFSTILVRRFCAGGLQCATATTFGTTHCKASGGYGGNCSFSSLRTSASGREAPIPDQHEPTVRQCR